MGATPRPIFDPGPDDASSVEWLSGNGPQSDVVFSSRVRLARNLAGFSFVHKCRRTQRLEILEVTRSWILSSGVLDRAMWVDLHDSPRLERDLLVERHLISKHLAKGKVATGSEGKAADEPRAVAIALPHERVSIMINEEDHLRVQVVRSGLALAEAWSEIDTIDDRLEAGLDYAFSPRFGYLTACPTNVGTGVRMSVMLHLPALKATGEIEKVKHAAGDMNLAVRGFYGEGSEALGDLYQISNQTTLGKGERAILRELAGEIIPQVVEYERVARRNLVAKQTHVLEDRIFRSLGLLAHARLVTTEEAMQHLSQLRLGVTLGLIKTVPLAAVNHLLLQIQPAHLQRLAGRELDQEQRRVHRATLLRQRLGGP